MRFEVNKMSEVIALDGDQGCLAAALGPKEIRGGVKIECNDNGVCT